MIHIVAGEVLKALNLENRAPAVCQVPRGRKFLAENDLILENEEGLSSGLSTTATFIYKLASPDQTAGDREKSAWDSLRGMAKKTFAALDGCEAVLKSEREKFYDRGRGSSRQRLGQVVSRICWDSMLFIYWLEDHPTHAARIEEPHEHLSGAAIPSAPASSRSARY
jgi:hypothetical protein